MKRVAILLALLLLIVTAIPVVYFATVDINDFQEPFLNAARDGDAATMTKLLDNGSDPNKPDGYGNTPLSIAAHFGQTDAAKLLIKNGAIVDGIANGEMTPLQCAVYSRRPETAAFLLKSNADPNIADKYGTTPLSIAACNGDVAIVKLLLDSGANIELADNRGWRPLHDALRSTRSSDSDRLATVKTLLEYGADPNANNAGGFEKDSEHDSHVGFRPETLPKRGNTPLTIANSNEFDEIAELLRTHRAN